MEYKLQVAIANYLRMAVTPGTIWFAVPNEGARTPRNGKRMKDMGRRPGVPDLIIYRGGMMLGIECKKPGSKQSESQRDMQTEFEVAQARYAVVDNLGDAILVLERIGAVR
jgi:hypothetical protein